jgi:hydroxymethylglutaryl-CoA lyase
MRAIKYISNSRPILPLLTSNSVNKLNKKSIKIIEVGPRDGLQNEKKVLSIDQRKQLIDKCTSIGLNHIEIGSLVNPKLLPQVSNTDILLDKLENKDYYSILVPHIKFLNLSKDNVSKCKEIVLFVAASESFNKKNINCDSTEAFNRFIPIVKFAKENGMQVRGSISTCLKCPYEGNMEVDNVLKIVDQYIKMDINLIDIADTIGEGTPEQTQILIRKIKEYYPIDHFTGHFHDTNDLAIQNVEVCLEEGMSIFHSSIGGLGGCPFSPKRAGNLSTEKLVSYLDKKGYQTGIKLEDCKEVGKWIQNELH